MFDADDFVLSVFPFLVIKSPKKTHTKKQRHKIRVLIIKKKLAKKNNEVDNVEMT